MENDQTGVSRGHNSPPMQDEGLNSKKENDPASSDGTRNPTEGVSERRIVYQPDSDVNLVEQILSRDNMLKAWERVKSNKGATGIDEMPALVLATSFSTSPHDTDATVTLMSSRRSFFQMK